jgi:hypothetical protein
VICTALAAWHEREPDCCANTPKGDLSRHSRDELDAAAALNSRPCKTLDWRTPR